MTTSDRRDVHLDDDRMLNDDRVLNDDDLQSDPDLAGGSVVDDDTTSATARHSSTSDEPLVADDSAVDYRSRWEVIQQGFVDDPRNAVSEADKLVDDLLKHLANGFDRQHQDLEQQWSDGEPSTEDLRSALQRYRAFFQRLLTI